MSDTQYRTEHVLFVPLLDDKRECYSNWEFGVLQILNLKECIEAIKYPRPKEQEAMDDDTLLEAQAKHDSYNKKAQGILVQYLGSYALKIAKKHPESAYDMWNALKQEYQNKSASDQTNFLTKLWTTKISENDKLENHLSTMENMVSDLTAAGVEGVADKRLISMIVLLSLPASYNWARTAITMMAKEELKLESVKNKLINHKISKEVLYSASTSNQGQASVMITD